MSSFDKATEVNWEDLSSREQVTAFAKSLENAQSLLAAAVGPLATNLACPELVVSSRTQLDVLRLLFKCAHNAVLSRLTRPSDLVRNLCEIITFKTPSSHADCKALDAEIHIVRGKALSVLANLMRYIPISTSSSSSGKHEERENCSIIQSVCVALHYVAFLFSDVGGTAEEQILVVPDAMHGYILLNQCVELLEVAGSLGCVAETDPEDVRGHRGHGENTYEGRSWMGLVGSLCLHPLAAISACVQGDTATLRTASSSVLSRVQVCSRARAIERLEGSIYIRVL